MNLACQPTEPRVFDHNPELSTKVLGSEQPHKFPLEIRSGYCFLTPMGRKVVLLQ